MHTGFPLSLYPPLTLWGWVRVEEKHSYCTTATTSIARYARLLKQAVGLVVLNSMLS